MEWRSESPHTYNLENIIFQVKNEPKQLKNGKQLTLETTINSRR